LISATKLELSALKKIADIIYSGFLAAGDAFCYLFAILKRWNFYDIHNIYELLRNFTYWQEIVRWQSAKFGANFEHILKTAEV